MKGYLQAEEAAKKWNVSIRQIQTLCKDGRIEGAEKFGSSWAIPENSPKPTRTAVNGKPGRKPKETI